MDTTNKPWFALRTKSNREYMTAGSLLGRGYETFLPLERPAPGITHVPAAHRPLFPGYVFCRFDIENKLPVLQNPGVVHIVSIGKAPAPIQDEEILSLRIAIESRFRLEKCATFVPGNLVKLTEGPLKGAQGTVLGNSHDLLVVSITLLQRSVRVSVQREWLQSALPVQ